MQVWGDKLRDEQEIPDVCHAGRYMISGLSKPDPREATPRCLAREEPPTWRGSRTSHRGDPTRAATSTSMSLSMGASSSTAAPSFDPPARAEPLLLLPDHQDPPNTPCPRSHPLSAQDGPSPSGATSTSPRRPLLSTSSSPRVQRTAGRLQRSGRPQKET